MWNARQANIRLLLPLLSVSPVLVAGSRIWKASSRAQRRPHQLIIQPFRPQLLLPPLRRLDAPHLRYHVPLEDGTIYQPKEKKKQKKGTLKMYATPAQLGSLGTHCQPHLVVQAVARLVVGAERERPMSSVQVHARVGITALVDLRLLGVMDHVNQANFQLKDQVTAQLVHRAGSTRSLLRVHASHVLDQVLPDVAI